MSAFHLPLSNQSMEKILFYPLTFVHCTIGIGLLFKIPGLYRADNFIVNGKPGDGTDDFEKIATTAFGACYFAQLIGIVYSHSI